jgi:hypothetical protein
MSGGSAARSSGALSLALQALVACLKHDGDQAKMRKEGWSSNRKVERTPRRRDRYASKKIGQLPAMVPPSVRRIPRAGGS